MSKTIKFLTLTALFIAFTSCSTDNDDSTTVLEIEAETVENLYAPQQGGIDTNTGLPLPISGDFTKFDFATGTTTTSETDWDIAFRGTSIIVNGGVSLGTTDEPVRSGEAAVYIANETMASVINIDTSSFIQDSDTGYAISGGNSWYTYAGAPTHLITPTPGKILVFKTRNGRYAKVEILSYYKDAPENPDAFVDETPYYTFNYVYQPNNNETSFE